MLAPVQVVVIVMDAMEGIADRDQEVVVIEEDSEANVRMEGIPTAGEEESARDRVQAVAVSGQDQDSETSQVEVVMRLKNVGNITKYYILKKATQFG